MFNAMSTLVLIASFNAQADVESNLLQPLPKSSIEQTCPHCDAVANDVLMLKSLTCPEGEHPSLVADFTQSHALFITLLTLKNNVSESQYQKRVNRLKDNATCSKESTLDTFKEKASSSLDWLNQHVQTYLK